MWDNPKPAACRYVYDGSFEGFLCCVFESFRRSEAPQAIVPQDEAQVSFLPDREIGTRPDWAARVQRAIPEKLGPEALPFVREAFLTCLADRELHLLRFLRLGFRHGPGVFRMLADDTVHTVTAAVRFLRNERHLMLEFLRFSQYGQVLVAQIEPKNFVLPLLAQHFCERFPEETFLIHDKAHGAALRYRPHSCDLIPLEELALPAADFEERSCRALWTLFYDTVEIRPRHNKACQRGHLPLRYRAHMTEFQPINQKRPAAEGTSCLPPEPDRSESGRLLPTRAANAPSPSG